MAASTDVEARRQRLAALIMLLGVGVMVEGALRSAPVDALLYALSAGPVAVAAVGMAARRITLRVGVGVGLLAGLLLFLRSLYLTAVGPEADPVALEYNAFRGLVLLGGAAFIVFGPRWGLWLSLTSLAAATASLSVPGGLDGSSVADAARVGLLAGIGIVMFRLLSVSLQDVRAQVDTATETAELAFLDDLTGLPNRRQMSVHLRASLARAIEGGGPDAVILFDLDRFKVVNDTMGHDVGDEVLIRTARTAQTAMRHADVLGRWGGEEFLVLLTAATLAEAVQVAERCRRLLAMEDDPSVTASFGVAPVLVGDTTTDLLRRADLALYEAKQAGRNRVVVAETSDR